MKAFPRPNTVHPDDLGMDLRDYFAAKAMALMYQFWLHDYYTFGLNDEDEKRGLSQNQTLMAETAYELADEMMKARK